MNLRQFINHRYALADRVAVRAADERERWKRAMGANEDDVDPAIWGEYRVHKTLRPREDKSE